IFPSSEVTRTGSTSTSRLRPTALKRRTSALMHRSNRPARPLTTGGARVASFSTTRWGMRTTPSPTRSRTCSKSASARQSPSCGRTSVGDSIELDEEVKTEDEVASALDEGAPLLQDAAAPAASIQGPAAIRNHAAFIWSIADLLRGDYKQSEYGKVIL